MPLIKDGPIVNQDPFTASQQTAEEPSPVEVFSAVTAELGRRRKLLLSVSLLTGLLAGIVAFLLPTMYTATASFIPPTNSSSSSMAALVGQLSSMGGSSLLGASKGSGDLYVGILKSHSIARAIVSQFHLYDIYKVKKESQAEKVLSSHSEFAAGTKDTIVSINVTDKDPVRARDMANAYLDALRSTSGRLALTENSQRRQFFEERLMLEKDELANAEVALKQTEEKTGLIAPAGQMASQLGAIAQLRSQIASREVRLASLRQDESDDNPDVIRVLSEIASLRSQVNQMENGNKGQEGDMSTAQVPGLELDYIRKARDVKYHETLFDIIAKQYEAARLDEAHDPSLQILDRATTPDTKSGPHRILITAAGFMVGLFLSIIWVLIQRLSRDEPQSAAV
jgi:tyrosine-protein kinase Etk/Wzc